ncbi:hypothetical protein JVT61DRAFT_13987 [Boletus reticuloceps]|uniref:Uncharacterized protein n=1 Tax=Boletus reticuloceps TaxID=495285 RepID=A0A8I3ADB8_9AGAM|nr:hypothetical protein JVT61DRAFT_13987 [Boletus reticuloceps]
MRFSLFAVLSSLAALTVVSAMPTDKPSLEGRLSGGPSDDLRARFRDRSAGHPDDSFYNGFSAADGGGDGGFYGDGNGQ